MDKLAGLMEFQQVDLEYDACEGALKNTPNYKRYIKVRAFLEEQKRIINRMTDAVDPRMKLIERTTANIDTLEEKYEDAQTKYEQLDKTDPAEVERYRKYYEQLNQLLANERREFSELAAAIEKDDATLSDMRAKLGKARKEFDEMKAKVEEERAEKASELDALRAKADEAAKSVDKELMEVYRRIKRSHAVPIAVVRGTQCGGCAMEISAVALRNLKEGAIIECDNCGRILYYQGG